MEEFDREEFEKRIRLEKDLEHLREDFSNHLEDEKIYTKKFEKVQENNNNILNRLNNTEDDITEIDECKEGIESLQDKNHSLDKTIIMLKVGIVSVGITALISLTAHPSILKFLEPVIKLIWN